MPANVKQVDQEASLRTELFLNLVADPGRAVADTVNLGLGVESQRLGQPLQDGPRLGGAVHRHARLRNDFTLSLSDTDFRFSPTRGLPLAGVGSPRERFDNGHHPPVRFHD